MGMKDIYKALAYILLILFRRISAFVSLQLSLRKKYFVDKAVRLNLHRLRFDSFYIKAQFPNFTCNFFCSSKNQSLLWVFLSVFL